MQDRQCAVEALEELGAWLTSFSIPRGPSDGQRFKHTATKMLQCVSLALFLRGGATKLSEACFLADAQPGKVEAVKTFMTVLQDRCLMFDVGV